MSNAGTPPPPGWYRDPHDPHLQRWWNGLAWSEQASPIRPGPAPRESPWGAAPQQTARRNNSFAVWGFVISIVAILLWALSGIASIVVAASAVPLGVVGLMNAKTLEKGRGLAIAAIIIGAFQAVGGIIILLA